MSQGEPTLRPFTLQKVLPELPRPRMWHVAVTWQNLTIVWGGYNEFNEDYPKSQVYYHLSGSWIRKETSGLAPQGQQNLSKPQVLNDKMFVIDFHNPSSTLIYSLDLKTWTWTRHSPAGIPPLKHSNKLGSISSWPRNGKVYYFGGLMDAATWKHEVERDRSWSELHSGEWVTCQPHYPSYLKGLSSPSATYLNQLFCYNIVENTWEWPNLSGDIPSPRSDASVIISEDTLFLFGGETFVPGTRPRLYYDPHSHDINDLHIMDLTSLTWKQVHGFIEQNLPTRIVPTMNHGCTLTSITQSTAVFFGAWMEQETVEEEQERGEDCWLLDLNKAKQIMDPSSIWTRIPNHLSRLFHAAVLEPVSQRLWVIGGEDIDCNLTSDVLKMSYNLIPLKVLAIDHAACNISADDIRLSPDQFPMQLRKEIEDYRSKLGEIHLCTKETGCTDCQEGEESDEEWVSAQEYDDMMEEEEVDE